MQLSYLLEPPRPREHIDTSAFALTLRIFIVLWLIFRLFWAGIPNSCDSKLSRTQPPSRGPLSNVAVSAISFELTNLAMDGCSIAAGGTASKNARVSKACVLVLLPFCASGPNPCLNLYSSNEEEYT